MRQIKTKKTGPASGAFRAKLAQGKSHAFSVRGLSGISGERSGGKRSGLGLESPASPERHSEGFFFVDARASSLLAASVTEAPWAASRAGTAGPRSPGRRHWRWTRGPWCRLAAFADGRAELLADQGLFAQDLRGPLKKLHIFRKCVTFPFHPGQATCVRGLPRPGPACAPKPACAPVVRREAPRGVWAAAAGLPPDRVVKRGL